MSYYTTYDDVLTLKIY